MLRSRRIFFLYQAPNRCFAHLENCRCFFQRGLAMERLQLVLQAGAETSAGVLGPTMSSSALSRRRPPSWLSCSGISGSFEEVAEADQVRTGTRPHRAKT